MLTLISTKPLDDPKLQELFSAAIDGAMASGYQNVRPPPEGHWLQRWWNVGRQMGAGEDKAEAHHTALMVQMRRIEVAMSGAPTGAQPVAWTNSESLRAARSGKRFITVWSNGPTKLYPIPMFAVVDRVDGQVKEGG